MKTIGLNEMTLHVTIGDHEGPLVSTQELRDELTEARWLASRRIRVSMSSSSGVDHPILGLLLEPEAPVMFVSYYGGTVLARETLRLLVERVLPAERPDTRRHWRWVGPLVGCAWEATVILIITRTPSIPGFHLRQSETGRAALEALSFILAMAAGSGITWLAYRSWFPPLERLPDGGQSRWDRRRTWVQVGLGMWLAIIGIVLALPTRK
jgi:hypothetical protein